MSEYSFICFRNNQENQYLEYALIIHNVTFEDEKDLKKELFYVIVLFYGFL